MVPFLLDSFSAGSDRHCEVMHASSVPEDAHFQDFDSLPLAQLPIQDSDSLPLARLLGLNARRVEDAHSEAAAAAQVSEIDASKRAEGAHMKDSDALAAAGGVSELDAGQLDERAQDAHTKDSDELAAVAEAELDARQLDERVAGVHLKDSDVPTAVAHASEFDAGQLDDGEMFRDFLQPALPEDLDHQTTVGIRQAGDGSYRASIMLQSFRIETVAVPEIRLAWANRTAMKRVHRRVCEWLAEERPSDEQVTDGEFAAS